MNTTAENQKRIHEGVISAARHSQSLRKPIYTPDTSPLYQQCVFHSELRKNGGCLALVQPTCLRCDECHFFKNKEDWYRDPYSGYVEKKRKDA